MNPPDFTCPNGHTIPERRFDAAIGCVVLACAYRVRQATVIDLEGARKALRGVSGLAPTSIEDAAAEPVLMTAWPAELSVEDEEGALSVPLAAPPTEDGPTKTLRIIVERVEALIGQREEINAVLRDVREFAKGCGFNIKAIGDVVRMRAQETAARQEYEGIVEVYRHALGIQGPDFLIALPPATEPPPPPEPKLSRKAAVRRDSMAMAALAAQAREDMR